MFKNIINKHILVTLLTLSLLCVPIFSFAAGTPSHLSYTGLLTDTGGNPLGGGGTTYYFKFSLWDDPTPGQGTKVWPTTSPGSSALTVKQGSFSVLIGDTSNGYPDTLDYDFNSNNPVYLQVEVSSDGNTYETLAPRSQLSSNAFSQVASRVSGTEDSSFGTTTGFANTLVSMLSTAVNKAVLTIKGAAGQVANLFNILDSNDNSLFTVTSSGNVGVGTSTPGDKLSVVGTTTVSGGPLRIDSLQFSDGVNYNTSSLYTSGSGSSQNIYFKAGSTNIWALSNSTLTVFNNGFNFRNALGSAVGPAYTFQNDQDTGIFSGGMNSDVLAFSTAGTEKMRIDASGNVGIGTTTPSAKLQINTSLISDKGLIIKGVSGQTANLQEWQDVNGTALSWITNNGSIRTGGGVVSVGNIQVNGGSIYSWDSRGVMSAPSDGVIRLTNWATTDFNRLQFGGTSSSFPSIKRNGSGIDFRLADDSGYASVSALNGIFTGNVGIGTTTPTSKFSLGSGQIEVPAGSASLPSYSFSGDLDTGMYSSYSNAIQFSTQGTLRFEIDNNYVRSSTVFRAGTASAGAPTFSFHTDSDTGMYAISDNVLGFSTGGTERFRVFNGAIESAGQVRGAAGSASVPSLTFSNDTNTGIFSLGSDSFGFSTGGTERLVIDASGNIGIGTSTPSSKLHIYGSGGTLLDIGNNTLTSTRVSIQNGRAYFGGYFDGVNDHAEIGANTGKGVRFYVNGNTFASGGAAMTILSNGNIGIGTTTPGSLLTLGSSGRIEVPLGTAGSPSVIFSGSTNAGLYSSATGGFGISTGGTERISISAAGNVFMNNAAALRGPDGTAGNPGYSFGLSAPDTGMFRPSGKQIGFSTNGVEKMRIDANGNVGIGTTSPIFPLDIGISTSSTQTYGYLNSAGSIGTTSGTNSYSMRAVGRILAPEFNAVSDARLKDVQFDLDSTVAFDAIKQLNPVSFTWKDSPNGQPVIGFLAQDVETIIPNAVSKVKGLLFDDQRTLDYNQIVAVLVGGVQKIIDTIEGYSKEFRTEKLCVGDTCITEDQLKVLLEKENVQSSAPTIEEGDNQVEETNNSDDMSSNEDNTDVEGDAIQTPENIVEEDEDDSGDTVPSSSESISAPEPSTDESSSQESSDTSFDEGGSSDTSVNTSGEATE
jgi:hypothetical protein